MALRLTAPSKDILGANYKITKIVASDYNPNIDSTITVTVTVKDVYDGPVADESVQVTCQIGKFTELNGGTISDTQSVTALTDSNGEISLTYSCSEWGIVNFSANNTSTQVNVQGWRQITSGTGQLWVNDETKTAVFSFSRNGAITSEISYANAIPSPYRPSSHVRMKSHNSNNNIFLIIEPNGTVRIMGTEQNPVTIACQITYAYDFR